MEMGIFIMENVEMMIMAKNGERESRGEKKQMSRVVVETVEMVTVAVYGGGVVLFRAVFSFS